jgi:hypothetical protein
MNCIKNGIKKKGESCTLNNNCIYPNCMKNLHLIPTDKPSRLCINGKNQMHIYITNDEEIREGDKILNPTNEVQTCVSLEKGIGTESICWIKVKETTTLQQILNSQKIILTTDQDLDDVQKIDDEFLEWFIKNPGCEYVEVESYINGNVQRIYEIIIPQEELKQETLEEAAERYYIDNIFCDGITEFEHDIAIRCYIAGAKHTTERMYSEEDMISFAEFVATYTDKNRNVHGQMLHAKSKYDGAERAIDLLNIWFEQFKKK